LPFAYYNRLTRSQQRVYQKSDNIASVSIPLDCELLALPDSFHTEGVYKRESSLLRQPMPWVEGAEAP